MTAPLSFSNCDAGVSDCRWIWLSVLVVEHLSWGLPVLALAWPVDALGHEVGQSLLFYGVEMVLILVAMPHLMTRSTPVGRWWIDPQDWICRVRRTCPRNQARVFILARDTGTSGNSRGRWPAKSPSVLPRRQPSFRPTPERSWPVLKFGPLPGRCAYWQGRDMSHRCVRRTPRTSPHRRPDQGGTNIPTPRQFHQG